MEELYRGVISFTVLAGLGFLFTRIGLIGTNSGKILSQLIYYLFFPLMVVDIFLHNYDKVSMEEWPKAFIFYFLVMLLSYTLLSLFDFSRENALNYEIALVFSSWYFLGYPMIVGILGKDGGAPFMALHFPFILLFFLYPGFRRKKWKDGHRLRYLSPLIFLILFYLIISFADISFHRWEELFHGGQGTIPMVSVLIGVELATISLREMLDYKLWIIVVLKLMVLPIFGYLIAVILWKDPFFVKMITLTLALPVSPLLAIFPGQQSHSTRDFTKIIFLSHLLSIISIPLIMKYLL
ncbi:MAG: hypothetical protein Q4P28_04615 [Tissierellia bacterium]|nr:hypothetical protein [Tissierellia bacterium]